MKSLLSAHPSLPGQSRRLKGFTLIELLTVIAIIGILAAIIIPTVGRVRSSAKSAECKSRLRQIGVAVRLYAEDNKGRMPPDRLTRAAIPGGPQSVNWPALLVPYAAMKGNNDGQLPNLPAGSDYSKDNRFFYLCPDVPLPVMWRAWSNYASHPVIMAKSTDPTYPISRVTRPSQVILMADGSQNNTPGTGGNGDVSGSAGRGDTTHFDRTYNPAANANRELSAVLDANNPNSDAQVGWFRYRHNNTLNALYMDGSVKAHARDTLTFGNVIDSR